MLKTTNLIGFGGGVSDTGPQTVALSSNDWDYQFDTGNEHPVAGNPLGDHTIGAYFKATGDGNNISTLITLDGDFDITFTLTETNQSEFGVYAIDEDGTRTTDQRAGMSSMTNSFWYRDESVTDFAIGSSYQSDTHTFADGSVVKIERRSGTIKVYDDDVVVHTYGTTYSGTMRFAKGDPGPAEADFDNFLIYDYSKIQRDGFWNETATGGDHMGDGVSQGRHVGETWIATRSGSITSVKINVNSINTGINASHAEIWYTDGTNPSSQVGSDSDTIALTSTGEKTYSFTDVTIKKGTTYWFIIKDDDGGSGMVELQETNGHPFPGQTKDRADTLTSLVATDGNSVRMEVLVDTSAGEPTPDHDTLLLIHSNTTDGSTTFTDSSQFGRTVTVVNNTHHDTGEAKFGSSAIYFDGTGDELTLAGASEFVVTSSDYFCIDFWFKLDNTTTPHSFCGGNAWSGVNADSWLCDYQYNTGSNDQYIRWANYSNKCSYTWGNSADTNWHHFQIEFRPGKQELFLDGTSVATSSHTGTWGSSSNTFRIGKSAVGTQEIQGYLDEFRISRISRRDANFSSPTSAYP